MRKFKIFLLLFMIILGCSCSASDNDSDKKADPTNLIVVGFSQVGAESDWRTANTISMENAFTEDQGYRLIFDDAQQQQKRQITAIRNFIQQGVDYIVVAPTTENGWDAVLEEAKAANIPVIIVDRMIEVDDESLFTCFVGSNFRKQADIAINWLEEKYSDTELKILHLQGSLGSSAQIGRTSALEEGLSKNKNWSLLAQASGEFTEAKGQEITEEFLELNDDFNVIYSENDNMAYGAIAALEKNGIKAGEDVTIISFDGNRDALMLILEGKISLCIECNPLHGPRVKSIIEQMEAGVTPEKFTYVVETYFDKDRITEDVIITREY